MNVNPNCNGYNLFMKIKFFTIFLLLLSSSVVFSAKYGKTDPDKLYTRALNFIEQERFFEGLEKARGLYEKALSLDAENKAALEYHGELFVELNMPALAQANLEKLNVLCPNSCEEAEQLKSFIAGTAIK